MLNQNVLRIARRNDWALIIAFAWTHSEVLNDLRKDPKSTIKELTKGESSKYPRVGNEIANEIANAAKNIEAQAEESPLEDYSGYLPIPQAPEGLENLETEVLKNLIGAGGLTGTLQCDRHPEEWAKIFEFAWSHQDNLKNIRQDPLTFLPQKERDKLLQTKYGILPLSDRPRGLNQLEIRDLESFLDDRDNMENIGGLFLVAS